MGKGDRRTTKGKRYNSSYGNARSRGILRSSGDAAAPVVKATKTAKKVVAKKAAK